MATQSPGTPPLRSRSLRLSVFLVAVFPMLAAVTLFAIYFTHRSLSQEEEALHATGKQTVFRLSESLGFDWATGNLPHIKRMLGVERHTSKAVALAITDNNTWLLAQGNTSALPVLTGSPLPGERRIGGLLVYSQALKLAGTVEPDPYLEIATSTHATPAYVVMVLSRDPVELARTQIILTASGMAILSLILAGILAWRLSAGVSKPLLLTHSSVRQLALGAWAERVPENAQGEIGELQRGINQMAAALEENQRMLEQRIVEATAELRGQKLEAESATQAKGRFLAAASHDLRQPLHALSLLVEALQEKVPDGDAKRLANLIEASAHNMESLLNALLDLSRLDAGVIVAKPECFPLERVFQNIRNQFADTASDKGIALRVVPSRIWLYTDPALLERILANLVGNALRYTDQGGVVLGVRRVQDSWLRLEIRDSGKGISSEFQDKIFEEYFQLANSERHRDKGLGLGLAIVARLARLLGSKVVLRSAPGRGSCFHLRFARCQPLLETTADELTADGLRTAQRPSGMPLNPLENSLVAFIDDDASILEAMLELFEHWGVSLVVGEDAEQVVRELQELNRRPDIILSDYRLKAGHTGIDAISCVQEAFGLPIPPIPAALITGDTSPQSIQAITQSGFPVLHKPLKPAKLRAFLAHLLASQPGQPPTP